MSASFAIVVIRSSLIASTISFYASTSNGTIKYCDIRSFYPPLSEVFSGFLCFHISTLIVVGGNSSQHQSQQINHSSHFRVYSLYFQPICESIQCEFVWKPCQHVCAMPLIYVVEIIAEVFTLNCKVFSPPMQFNFLCCVRRCVGALCVRGILKLFLNPKPQKTFHEQCELRIYFPIQLSMLPLTMMSKCGIVTRSSPRNPLALLVRSGRKMKVFFISKLTESFSSLSSRSYFSFHSLGVFHSMNVSCESKYTYKKM